MQADPHAWKKHAKRSLLLLAFPLVSALLIGTLYGDATWVGRKLAAAGLALGKARVSHVEDFVAVRTPDELRVHPDGGMGTAPPNAIVADIRRSRWTFYRGTWAPTSERSVEAWSVRLNWKRSDLNRLSEYDSGGKTLDDLLKEMGKKAASTAQQPADIAMTQNWKQGQAEYAAQRIRVTGFIHNTIVLLCTGAGFFEFGRAIRARRRE